MSCWGAVTLLLVETVVMVINIIRQMDNRVVLHIIVVQFVLMQRDLETLRHQQPQFLDNDTEIHINPLA